jgi:predicted transcriptional regulator
VSHAELPLGSLPPSVTLSGAQGGRTDGRAWCSDEMRGKVTMFFYIDPDERKVNDPLFEALKKEQFDDKKVASVSVLNLAAAWMPNWALEPLLAQYQKKYPRNTYVLDKDRVLVKAWHLADENSDFAVLAADGKVLFSRDGKVSDGEIAKVLQIIRTNSK